MNQFMEHVGDSMKVYVVVYGARVLEGIAGVFSTEERAKEYIETKLAEGNGPSAMDVYDYDLDEENMY